jgi:hypothetical protein
MLKMLQMSKRKARKYSNVIRKPFLDKVLEAL